ncbi:hypothetical protein BV898_11364 [Hypsibius exemplaris]|uniref:Uncharacterized protein n=1 Tax=Hypsibius exemplaris TaxID=2072580 RepID=A0A1W0WGQ4_HYPEX|nr:hypothetical protein BV898_11364 [Hypsibius exemplaris]
MPDANVVEDVSLTFEAKSSYDPILDNLRFGRRYQIDHPETMYAALLNAIQENMYYPLPGWKATDAAFLLYLQQTYKTSLEDHQFKCLFRDAWMKVEKDRSENGEEVDGQRCSIGQLSATSPPNLARVERVSKGRCTNCPNQHRREVGMVTMLGRRLCSACRQSYLRNKILRDPSRDRPSRPRTQSKELDAAAPNASD